MPIPTAALAFEFGMVGSVSNFATGLTAQVIGQGISALTAPNTRGLAYGANQREPNVYPPAEQIIIAAKAGLIDIFDAEDIATRNGVHFLSRPGDRALQQLRAMGWGAVTELSRAKPGPSEITGLLARGRITQDQYSTFKVGLYADWERYADFVAATGRVQPESSLWQLWKTGKITEEEYLSGMRANGWFSRSQINHVGQVTPLPSLFTMMRDWYLQTITDEQYAKYAAALGHTDPEARRMVESTFFQMPSGPELVNLAVRDAWNADVVQRWGYDAEFPPELLFFMRAQGWDWGRSFTTADGRRVPSVHWPQLFWRAHWQVISPGQAYQAFRRLRPERINRYRQQFPGLTPFTADDLRTVLRVHDYPPAAREWLAALQSQPLRMLTIRTAYTTQARPRAWAEQQLADIGYLADDAATILDTIDRQVVTRQNAWVAHLDVTSKRQTAQEIVAGFDDGFVERQDAMSRLSTLGVDTDVADRMLTLAESRRLRADLRQALAVLRREYLAGALSDGEVIAALQSYRVSANAQARYLSRWQGLRSLERRTAATGQILAWVREGMMTAAAAQLRLANLGWAGADALLLVNEQLHKLETHEAVLAQHQAKQSQASAKQLQFQIKASQAAIKAAQKQLAHLTPLSTIKKWATAIPEPIVSLQWARERLLAMGFDNADINRYFAQWAEESAAKAAGGKAGKTGPPAVPAAQPLTGTPPGG